MKVSEQEREKIACICASFYANKRYFHALVKKVQSGKRLTPPEYRRMCCNKYAKRVNEATLRKPRYAPGTLVSFSKKSHFRHSDYFDKGAIILEADAAPVRTAQRNAKRYKIMILGTTTILIAEERCLKPLKSQSKKKNLTFS